MTPRPLILVPLLILTLGLAPSALAGPNVPDVASGQLPVAGTCAPIAGDTVTWVTVGELGWYRIDRDPQEVGDAQLAAVIEQRAAAAATAGRAMDVWIVCGKDRTWGHVVKVLLACQQWGVFRVGLQVQAESGEGVMGFPLFLPPPHEGTALRPGEGVRRGQRLPVRMELSEAPPSDMRRLYAAAQVAASRFGPLVAEVSVEPRTPVQQAVTAIDLLYRAGCAAVTVRYRLMIRSVSGPRQVQVFIEKDRLLPSDPLPVEIPAIRARKAPWTDDGAAFPGAHTLVLEDIGGASDAAAEALPNFAGTPEGVPPEVLLECDRSLREWGRNLGGSLVAVITRNTFPEGLLVKRRRQGMGAMRFFAEAKAAFPRPDRIVPTTLRAQVYLFRGTRIVGKADVTAHLAGPQVGVVFGHWVAEEFPQGLTLPPVETDPFVAGTPGHLRVWFEGLLHAAMRGPATMPLAGERDVLSGFPTAAHAGVSSAIRRRGAGLENLAAWVRATPYDRIYIAAAEGTAAVVEGGRVSGILRFSLEAEAGELALSSLTPRVAPR